MRVAMTPLVANVNILNLKYESCQSGVAELSFHVIEFT